MANVINIGSAKSQPQGPRVPEAYSRQGRDAFNSRSNQREIGSVSGDYSLLSETAQIRLEKAGLIIAGAAIVGTALYGLSKADEPVTHDYNPSGIVTSGAESE